jgi:NAD(P)-dependent dehydrogenase (short-subunit alcohol dehydrogenase family)
VTGSNRPLALVTGGLHRIGASIAAALARAGYDLALHKRSPTEPDADLAAALAESGVDHRLFRQDLAQAGAAASLFAEVTAAFGRPPTLIVNNASRFTESDLESLDEGELTHTLAINLNVPVMLTCDLLSAVKRGIAAQGTTPPAPGRPAIQPCVINILDQRVSNPVPDQFAYTIAKQALWQATRTMAIAAAPHVRVNAVAPGLTLPTQDYAPGQMDRLSAAMPLNLLPTPEAIAEAALYLAQAPHVTGQTIFVDGGANLRSYERDFVRM